MILRFVLPLVLVGLAFGCQGQDPTAVVNQHRAASTAKIEAIVRAGKAADDHKYESDQWPKDAVSGLDFTSDASNAVFVIREDIEAPNKDAEIDLRFIKLDDDPFRESRRILGIVSGGTSVGYYNSEKAGPLYDKRLKQIERTRYALIVYTTRVTMPRESATMVGGSRSFEAGEVRGMALLVDVDSGKLCGGFDFSAESSEKVRATEKLAQEKINDDLANQFGKAVTDGVEKRFPGAKVPGTFGFGW